MSKIEKLTSGQIAVSTLSFLRCLPWVQFLVLALAVREKTAVLSRKYPRNTLLSGAA